MAETRDDGHDTLVSRRWLCHFVKVLLLGSDKDEKDDVGKDGEGADGVEDDVPRLPLVLHLSQHEAGEHGRHESGNHVTHVAQRVENGREVGRHFRRQSNIAGHG